MSIQQLASLLLLAMASLLAIPGCGTHDALEQAEPSHEAIASSELLTSMTPGATFWGTGELRTFTTSDATACSTGCMNDVACSGGTFNPTKQLCWLRTGSGALGGGLPSDSGFMTGATERNAYFTSKMTKAAGFWGSGELRTFVTPDATQCYTACANDSACSGGTFNPDKQSCWLRVGSGSFAAGLANDYAFMARALERNVGFNGNTVYGHWQGSGGQSPSSLGNRVLLLDYTGAADTATFTLTSSADAYLYLLDASGNVLAQDNNSGGGTHARLSLTLSTGSYKLVAATATAGQSAEFSLSSDKAPLRYPQRLELKPASRFVWIYDDSGTGANANVSIWRPDLSQYPGFYSLGDVAMGSHGQPPRMTFLVRGEGDLLAKPIDYSWIWSDSGSGGTHDGSFWQPVAPSGYTCLGAVAVLGYSKPSTELIRCVKSGYVLPANPSWAWQDSGSGANDDLTLWQAAPRDHRGLSPSTFVARPNYGDPGGDRYWVLNKSATANEELRGVAVDSWAVAAFAPRVWLAPGESHWPSSTQFHLANVHEENGHLVTNQPLGCDSCTDPQFLDGQRPDQTPVPVYAQIIRRTQGGAFTHVTDVLYWNFYPYNNGKRVCIGWYSPWGCVGGYSTFGNHVGDWEHFTVRFIDGRPAQVYLSQHANGQTFSFGDKGLLFTGWHPEIFAAQGSHGLYPDAARHIYETIFNGDFLADDTGYGLAWNTWTNVVPITWQAQGTYLGSLSWMNITSAWGNPEGGCDNPTGYCINSGGPGALMSRSVSNPEFMTLE